MGAAVAPIAIGSSIASAGFSAAGTVAAGRGTKAGYEAKAADAEFQAARAERAAEFGRIQADQTDVQLREELSTTLANIDAIRAVSNIDPRSPTGVALKENETGVSDRQRRNQVTSIRLQAAEDERMAKYSRSTAAYMRQVGDYALRQSKIAAVGQIIGGIGKGAGMAAPPRAA